MTCWLLAGLLAAAPALGRAQTAAPVAPGPVAAAAGSWSAFVDSPAGLQTVPWTTLGLDPAEPDTRRALASLLDKSSLTPQSLLARPDPRVTDADRIMTESHRALRQTLVEAQLAARGADRPLPELERRLAELTAYESLAPMLGPLQSRKVLQAAGDLSRRLDELQATHVIQRAEELRRAWADRPAGDWADVVDAIASPRVALAGPKLALSGILGQRWTMLEDAIERAKGLKQSAVSALYLDGRLRETRAAYDRLPLAPGGAEAAVAAAAGGKPLSSRDALWLMGLSAYAPIDPTLAVMERDSFDYYIASGKQAGGWTMAVAGKRPTSILTVAAGLAETQRAHIALHEGFHQADAGYAAGRRALQGVVGDAKKGSDLATVLLEGYTEYRARKAFLALMSDGRRRRSAFARNFYLRAQMESVGWYDPGDPRVWQERWAKHPYQPYVSLVQEILSLPGGRDALEAFVSRGEASGLVRVLGRESLWRLASVASLEQEAFRGSASVPRERLAQAAGLPLWLGRRLSLRLIGDEPFRRTMRFARAFRLGVDQALAWNDPDGSRKMIEAALRANDPKRKDGKNDQGLWDRLSGWRWSQGATRELAFAVADHLRRADVENPKALLMWHVFKPYEVKTPFGVLLFVVLNYAGDHSLLGVLAVLALGGLWKLARWRPRDLSAFLANDA